jgi:asparagine synthase (glutamine-hydrolysing)
MSGIFGFAYLDGQPASPEHFQKMADEMASWGPDGVGRMISGNAAFGHALLIVTHESRFEKMPIHDRDMGILFTAAARLDNRDELCDFFSIPHPERPTTSDGQLVLKAYKKWGTDSCRHIFGDWSFAAWHIKERRLFLARDHLGNTGLDYYFKPPLIVFASNTEGVLAHPEVPRKLNEMHLAQRMVFDYSEETLSQTYWTDVCFLTASHAVTFTGKNKQIEKYWRLNEAPVVRFASDAEYLEGFLEQYRRAVRVRLNSIRPVGSTLSAGLDSSSVTALAAEALQKSNQPLIAYTSVPLYPSENLFSGRLTDEWPLAHSVAEFYDNIEHIPICADDITLIAAIKRSLDILHTPQHAASNMFWIISMLDNARCHNLGVMLTGQLGNGGVSWSGGRDYIFYLFARLQWCKGFRALALWKYRAIKNQLLRPVLLPLWSEYQRFLNLGKQTKLFYSFPEHDFISRMGLNGNDMARMKEKRIDPSVERRLMIINNGTIAGPIWHNFGTYYGMEVRDPTADIRLIEFCQGVPCEQNTFKGGQRMMIRRAMAGIIPDAVRCNFQSGKQASDIFFRLAGQHDTLKRELDLLYSQPDVTKYIDIMVMKRICRSMQTSQSLPTANVEALLRAINTGHFLSVFFQKGR